MDIELNSQSITDGENESETAEQTESSEQEVTDNSDNASENADAKSEEQGVNVGTAEPPVDDNAKYAAARRQAEEEIHKRDAEFERRFGHLTNPITGKPIQSEKDYFDALDAQEQLRINEELRSKDIDPEIINTAIANNPMIRQASEIIERTQKQQVEENLKSDFAEIQRLNPDIKSMEQIENFESVLGLIKEKGLSLAEAYKITNFEILAEKKSAAAKQATINQAKGKEHLHTTDGVAASNDLVDIPANVVPLWREWFPDKNAKQLKEAYNNSLHR